MSTPYNKDIDHGNFWEFMRRTSSSIYVQYLVRFPMRMLFVFTSTCITQSFAGFHS